MHDVVDSPDQIQEALKEYWGPVYEPKPFDSDKAQKLFKLYFKSNSHLFEFNELEDPEVEDFANTISHARHSASGPDGIGYAAYKANISLSSQVLHNRQFIVLFTNRLAVRDLDVLVPQASCFFGAHLF